jgi:diacylglycerol kinase (ATP)
VSKRPLLILNPASAGGRTGRRQSAIAACVRAHLEEPDLIVTGGPGDARAHAFKAVAEGRDTILVGGGDGTVSEVIAGAAEAGLTKSAMTDPRIGLLPLGSGGDFARSLGLPRSLGPALAVVKAGATRRIDVGRFVGVQTGAGGEMLTRCFANEVSAGLSAATIRRVGRWAKRVGARLGFAGGAVASILTHRPVGLCVEVDDQVVHQGPVSLVVVANGRFFGAGMEVAPGADPADGRLEVVVVRGLSVPRLLVNLPSLFAGTHGAHPSVSFHAARRVSISPLPRAGEASGDSLRGAGRADPGLDLDVDGEPVGRLPIRVELLPAVVEVFVPSTGSVR